MFDLVNKGEFDGAFVDGKKYWDFKDFRNFHAPTTEKNEKN
jgi:hypothetical protein